MFGKTYNTVGTSESNFLIKTSGDFKVQQGNKFIDIIKDGKINAESTEIFFQVETPDQIKQSGVYLVENKDLWICINGVKFQINTK